MIEREALILRDLQSLFPDGRKDLSPADIALYMGKTKSAVDHLITRGRLPYPVRKVGNRRCVSIYDVAKWHASHPAMELDITRDSSTSTKRGRGRKGKRAITPISPELSDLAIQILSMRHDALHRLASMAMSLPEDEAAFVLELAQRMAFDLPLPATRYVMVVKTFAVCDGVGRHSEDRRLFSNLGEGMRMVAELQSQTLPNQAVHVWVREGRQELYRASCLAGRWHVDHDQFSSSRW